MWPNPQDTGDSVKFTEEILNWKLYFLCSDVLTNHIEGALIKSLAKLTLLPIFLFFFANYVHNLSHAMKKLFGEATLREIR